MTEFVIVGVCILINGLLAASEMAFVTVRKSQLREAAKGGVRRADYLLKMRDNPERTLSIVQIGITLVGAIAAAVGGAGAEEFLSPILEQRFNIGETAAEALSIAAVVIPITYLSVVFGELIPKTIALRNAYHVAIFTSYPLSFLDRLLSPIVSALEWSTRKFLSPFYKRKETKTPEVETNIELDSLAPLQRQYVLNVVELGKKTLNSIYTPWKNVTSVKISQSLEEVEHVFLTSGHTRLPVFRNQDAIGIINSRELMAFKQTEKTNWTEIIRPAVNLQSRTPLLQALRVIQEKKGHMIFILSEYNQIGMVTLEDILEEVVGEIYDEDDDGTIKRILSMAPKRKFG